MHSRITKKLPESLFIHQSNNLKLKMRACVYASVRACVCVHTGYRLVEVSSKLLDRVAPRKHTSARSQPPRGIPFHPTKERREKLREAAYFGRRRRNFPRRRGIVVPPWKVADVNDNASPPCVDLRARVCVCCEKLRASGGLKFAPDRTTYTCRIGDLFRHAAGGT